MRNLDKPLYTIGITAEILSTHTRTLMMYEHLGWTDAAADIVVALEATIADKVVTYDFARLMDGATEVKCSEFASAIVDRL